MMENKLKLIVDIIEEKKGEQINIIDMSNVASLASTYVICSVGSERQALAIANEIEKQLILCNYDYSHIEGKRGSARWVLLDAYDTLIHIFHKDEREKYGLDTLWADQPSII